jgi:hypothetical protein
LDPISAANTTPESADVRDRVRISKKFLPFVEQLRGEQSVKVLPDRFPQDEEAFYPTKKEMVAWLQEYPLLNRLAGEAMARRIADLTRWNEVKGSWQEAEFEAEKWSLLKKAGNAATAILSGYIEDQNSPVVLQRIESCHKNPCPSRAYSKEKRFHYCNDCGCGEKDIARLSDVGSEESKPTFNDPELKLRFVKLACPRKKPGFSNAV